MPLNQFSFPEEETGAEVVTLAMPKEEEIERKVPALVDQAAAIVIRDQEGMTAANDFSIAIKRMKKEIEETFDPIIDATNRAHQVALDKKKKYIEPVVAAEKMVKGKIGSYLDDQARIRREAERKIWEAEQEKIRAQQEANRKAQEAERKAAEERQRVADAARRQAEEAEAKAARARSEEGRRKAQEEADRIRREAAEKAAAEKSKADAEQARLREEAAKREAEIVKNIPATVARVETKGISTREDWDCEVINEALVPREFLVVDEVKLRKYAKAMKANANVSGVRFFPKTIVQQRIA